ncbi:MAG TPA: cytochrome b5 domain-containing protein [Syntrophales bacterium]|nr:cytochrome b5 domain-containing protein [Syntrophales bacterium]HPL67551.1 cytochrome b5 domain-containing protein [Smithellaceae bacterium]HPN08837.1 cytochrome b5 domain-containing protein [Syntrophales bacterium]HPX81556.1 cytochrome b5 domain-containing protein [Syntrophales bacterium]HQB13451.1 cytochrome b5 domain-containing protein [Syntrophales bacterium]
MKEFDSESLSTFNGKDGQPCYFAHGGRVIDVSGSRLWKTGVHMKRHQAGRDLTLDIKAAPHGPDVLDRYPHVGTFAEETKRHDLPAPLETMLERLPFLRRHPHPMAVHFPMAFSIAPALFYSLYLITMVKSFETTALHCLGASILFLLPAVITGFLTWRINYQAKTMRAVRIKIRASFILLAVALGSFLLRLQSPKGFAAASWEGVIYFLLLLALVPIVAVIGWHGGSLTFPVEGE